MERLTKRIGVFVYYTKGKYEDTLPAECETQDVRDILSCLAAYEDIGLEPQEIERIVDAYGRGLSLRTESAQRLELVREIQTDRLWEIAEAERNGRVKIIRKPDLGTYGSCRHFCRIDGRAIGNCKEQPYCKDKRGTVYTNRKFRTTQSRKACKKYIPEEEPTEG